MTVPSSVAKSGPYICNGVTDVFNYDFRIVDKSHLNVILTDANGAETSLVLTTHYTVSDVGSDTGSINLTAAGVALAVTGTTLTILRNPPFTQETDLQNQGAYLAQTVEDRFDLLTMQIQTVKERSDRSIAVPASDEDTTLDDLTADLVKVAGVATDVSTVAARDADIGTVASISADVTTVAGIADKIPDAANFVLTTATDASTFGFVAGKDDTPADKSKAVPTAERAEFFSQGLTDTVDRTISDKLRETKSVLDFGAVGDCTGVGQGTDDSAAIQKAFDWLAGGSFRTIIFPDNHRYRIGSATTCDLNGMTPTYYRGQRIVMLGTVTPDATAMDAITIYNGWEGHLELNVYEGGVDADYTTADPTGGSQVFVLRGLRGFTGSVRGRNVAGRMLRIPPEVSGEPKFSNSNINQIYYEASNTGQGWWIDPGETAFGFIAIAWNYYGKYGSKVLDTSDVSFGRYAQGTQNNGGDEILGCISLSIAQLDGADVTSPYVSTALTIADNPDSSRECFNVTIGEANLVPGAAGLVLRNISIGPAGDGRARTGCTIGHLKTLNISGAALEIDNCRNVKVLRHDSQDDENALVISGTLTENIEINCGYRGVKGTAIDISGTFDNIVLTGYIDQACVDDDTAPVVRVQDTGRITFQNFNNFSNNGAIAYDLPASNNVRIHEGRIAIGSGGTNFGVNRPKYAHGVEGYRTKSIVTVTMLSGTKSIVGSHGLAVTPSIVLPVGRSSTEAGFSTATYTATQFTVYKPANVAADTGITCLCLAAEEVGF